MTLAVSGLVVQRALAAGEPQQVERRDVDDERDEADGAELRELSGQPSRRGGEADHPTNLAVRPVTPCPRRGRRLSHGAGAADYEEAPMVDFSLDEDYTALRETVAAFARDVVAPQIGELYERGEFPSTSCVRWARWGCSACRSPRSTAGWVATTSPSAWRSRSWPGWTPRSPSPSRPRCRSEPCRSSASGRRSSRTTWLPRLTSGEVIGAFGLTEPGGGLGRRCHAHDGAPRRRQPGSSMGARRSSPTAAPRSPGFVTVTAVTGRARRRRPGDLHDPGSVRDAWLHRRTGVLQGRLALLGHP